MTCSYQQGDFLEQTMLSVLDQDYPNLEYLVFDGGSKDGSVEIIEKYADRLDYWESEPDRGQTHALNKGFDRATGEIYGWLCSDDLLLPGALKAVGEHYAKNPECEFVHGDSVWIDREGMPLRPKREMSWSRFAFLFDHNYLAQPSCFWRSSLHDKVGGLDEKWDFTMDADLWIRFARHCKPQQMNRFLSCMRFYPEQKTVASSSESRSESCQIRSREAPALSRLPELITRPIARTIRIAKKLVAGGYASSIPAELASSISQYKIR